MVSEADSRSGPMGGQQHGKPLSLALAYAEDPAGQPQIFENPGYGRPSLAVTRWAGMIYVRTRLLRLFSTNLCCGWSIRQNQLLGGFLVDWLGGLCMRFEHRVVSQRFAADLIHGGLSPAIDRPGAHL